MRKLLMLLAVPLLCASLAACRGSGSGVRGMLQGTWAPVTAELGGQPFPAAVLSTMQLRIDGEAYEVSVAGQLDKGTIRYNMATRPRAMDITGTEGPNQGKTYPAIFELEGDTLRICYDLAGKDRPGGLTSAAGTQQFLVRYRRVRS